MENFQANGTRMGFYPILINLQGQKAVVIGGGRVAERKIESLLDHGATVYVTARELTPTLKQYVQSGAVRHQGCEFDERDLNGAFVVIAATDDPMLNRKVSKAARRMGLLINAVDQPSDCNFIVPSVLRRGELLISVSTSGKSPALSRKIRRELEKVFGSEYEALLNMMGRLRTEILSRGRSSEANRRVFQELVDSDILDAVRMNELKKVAALLTKILEKPVSDDDVRDYLKAE